MIGRKKVGPVGKFVVDGRFDMRKIQRKVMLEPQLFPKTGKCGG